MEVKLLRITEDPDGLIEEAGRLCYLSKKGDRKIIHNWIKQGHESMLEHPCATFLITGVSRAESHQHVRHRIASYSQQSQRYVDENNFSFVTPPAIASNNEANKLYQEFMEQAKETYGALRNLNIKKEDARFVLPNATHTHFVTTMNFRSLRNFLKLRTEPGAQWEIKYVANCMLKIVKEHAPHCFYDFEVDTALQKDFFD